MSTSGGTPAGGLLVEKAHLTAADLLTLNSAPTELLPAPPAGQAAVVVLATFEFVTGVATYAGNAVTLNYTNAAGPLACPTTIIGLMTTAAHFGSRWTSEGPSTQVLIPLAQIDGQPIYVASAVDPPWSGPIVTTALNNGGTGYAIGDTGTLDGGGVLADYIVDTVDLITGAVLTYNLTSFGDLYTVTVGDTTTPGGGQPGIGAGLLLDIVDIVPADGDLYVTVQYVLVPVV
jgi:hypothetical protein